MTGGRGGLLFDDGPTACPFLALDRDRERRADEPDTRHRCYATATPEPRALAHQRNYCLTANFSACPIFQDWAIRSAARPVPLRPIPPALALSADESRPVGEPEFAPPPETAEEATDEPEQAVLFDETPPKPAVLGAAPPMPTFRLTAPLEEGPATDQSAVPPPAIIPPPSRPAALATPPSSALASQPISTVAAPPAPPVQPKPSPSKPIKPPKSPLRREDIVPSWERSHYDVPDPGRSSRRSSGGRDVFSWLTVAFSILAVITLVAIAVLMLPALFGGKPGGATPTPTLAAGVSPTPGGSSPSADPTPASTWQTYTIKLGDSLYGIATKFNVTYDQLLAANPQITNPDFIVVGQVINVPPPSYVAPTPTAAPTAQPTPTVTPKPTKKR